MVMHLSAQLDTRRFHVHQDRAQQVSSDQVFRLQDRSLCRPADPCRDSAKESFPRTLWRLWCARWTPTSWPARTAAPRSPGSGISWSLEGGKGMILSAIIVPVFEVSTPSGMTAAFGIWPMARITAATFTGCSCHVGLVGSRGARLRKFSGRRGTSSIAPSVGL